MFPLLNCPFCQQELFSEEIVRCPACGRELDQPAVQEPDFDSTTETHLSEEFAVPESEHTSDSEDFSSADFSEVDSAELDSTPLDSDISNDSVDGEHETYIEDELPELESPPGEQTINFTGEEALSVDETFILDDKPPVAASPPAQQTVSENEDNDAESFDATFEIPSESVSNSDLDPQATIAIDPDHQRRDSDDEDIQATFLSDDFDSSEENDEPDAGGRTLAMDSEGDNDSFDETVTSEDLGSSGQDSSQTLLSDENDEELRTIQSNWGASGSDMDPRMTIKSRGDLSVDDSGLVGDSISSVPRRTLHAEGDQQSKLLTPEYKLVKVLGEGGMGIVWSARQTSVDRNVAVKMIKGKLAQKRSQRQKFLAEAIVTGDLDHPNIVPIYDVGSDDTGSLFYSMKQVQGTPWLKVIKDKSLNENLDILLRTSDAIAFAHDRGIVHRDLKPENVMLGSYGEVLVMDWGLAFPTHLFDKADKIRQTASMGGTPAYMAPEMATGPIDRITPSSDIYLLGAILWEIITGKPPHPGRKVQECLLAAMRNEIRPTEKTGELVDIALKAMATDPVDRHLSVSDFQKDLRDYLSHSESVAMTARAKEKLEHAQHTNDYNDFSQCVFEFQEAYNLWNGNHKALTGINASKLAYAQSALAKGDLDLSASLLDDQNPDHQSLILNVEEAVREREAKHQRLKLAKRIMTAMAICLFAVISVAFVWINSARSAALEAKDFAEVQQGIAEEQKGIAVQQRDKATEQTKIAVAAKIEEAQQRQLVEKKNKEVAAALVQVTEEKQRADEQRDLADEQRVIAIAKQKEAEEAKEAEIYEAYIARIGLASAKIDENAFDVARKLLEECPPQLRNWEWGRLMHLCQQASLSFTVSGPVDAVAFSPDGTRFITGSWDRTARIYDLNTEKVLFELPQQGLYVHSVAWSPTRNVVVTTGNDKAGLIRFWNADNGQPLAVANGHTDAVVKARFSPDGNWLMTCSYDQTARLWDVHDATRPLEVALIDGHSWWVWDAAFTPSFKLEDPEADNRIVTVGQDGKAIVWKIDAATAASITQVNFQQAALSKYTIAKEAVFSEHAGPVYAVSFAPDGKRIATAGNDKRILLWNPEDVPKITLDELLSKSQPKVKSLEFAGHTAPVQCIDFSKDGSVLASGGRDNAVKVWDLKTGAALKTFRGHFSGVRCVAFSPDGRRILSGGQDQQAIVWSIDDYEEFRVLNGRTLAGHNDAILGAEFSPNGEEILTASRDRTARTWETKTGNLLHEFTEGHDYLASEAVFFPDGRTLVTAAADNTVRLWNVVTGTQFHKLSNTGRSAVLALSADAKWLATGSEDDAVQIWKTSDLLKVANESEDQTETPVASTMLSGHNGRVTAIAFSPKENLLLTCDANGRCLLHNPETGEVLWNVKHHTSRVTACGFLPDGSQILTASNDNTVSRLDAKTGEEQTGLVLKHETAVVELAISEDGNSAITINAGAENTSVINVWNLKTATKSATSSATDFAVNDVSYTPNGQTALLVCTDNTVRTFSIQNNAGVISQPLLDFQKLGGLVWSARFNRTGDSILSVGGSEARIWDATTLQMKMSFSPHGSVAAADFSPDGKQIVTGSWDNSAKIWNAQTAQSLQKLEGGHQGYINSVHYAPNGKQILTASDDGTAKLWDVSTLKIVQTYSGHSGRIRQAIFSPDGSQVLTVSTDRTARLWNAETGDSIGKPFSGHRWAVLCAAFSLDGKRILTGSEDNEARLWDAETQATIAIYSGHTAAVTSVAFSIDGNRIFTASEDNSAKLWDATPGHEGTEVLTLAGHQQELTSVRVSRNGDQVLTSSRDGTAIIWLTTEWKK